MVLMCSQYYPHSELLIDPQPSTSALPSSLFSAESWEICNLARKDFDSVLAICREAFPLDYPESWFEDVVNGKYIAFGLFHMGVLTSLLVAEIKTVDQCDKEDKNLYHNPKAETVYILSLAVTAKYRRNGIATILLNHLLKNVVRRPPCPKLVFLHVLHSNYGAINFYRKNGFRYHATLPGYYLIDNVYQDGLTFVLYTNNARPPWSFKEFCNVVMSFVCRPFRWVLRCTPCKVI